MSAYSRYGAKLPKQDLRRDVNEALLAIEGEVTALQNAPTMPGAALLDAVRVYHVPIMTAAAFRGTAGKEPTATSSGPLLLMNFTIGQDEAFVQFKIPSNFAGDAKFHIHWTKSSNADELGKRARWRVTYVAFPSSPSNAGEGTGVTEVLELEDVYEDNGTTTRKIHCTEHAPFTVVPTPGWYMSMKIEAVAPTGGTAMASEPALFGLGLTFNEYINK